MKKELLNKPYKVAAVSASSESYNLQAGLEKANRIVEKAAKAGAILVVFPETWLPGFLNGNTVPENISTFDFAAYIENSIEIGSEEWYQLTGIAKKHNVYLSMSYSRKESNYIFMGQTLIDPNGKAIDMRDKIRPSGDDGERMFFSDVSAKENLIVHQTPLGRIGQLSCGEHFNPMMTFPMMAQTENVHIAAFPIYTKEGKYWWEKAELDIQMSAAKHYVISYALEEHECWVVEAAVNRSFIMNPEGYIVAKSEKGDGTEFCIAEIDPSGFKVQAYNSTEKYTWEALKTIQETYKGPREENIKHEKLNMVDIEKVKENGVEVWMKKLVQNKSGQDLSVGKI
ncbi:nitrilase-related carbon-nitrogen hydrolase [Priestia flexa]|jgi:predicted amidohydrolase|uniref:nitrilase-related carbon-nitrogen hydrolase n=1 Tax=Priestia flexa TaxID=86664 RepID=UPI00099B4C6E|nr:nitrilase-related carbon-nitrogen hydrolase [Priestia flexa]AQX56140.1 hypothetical protein BC359_18825 [Priestia flexa]